MIFSDAFRQVRKRRITGCLLRHPFSLRKITSNGRSIRVPDPERFDQSSAWQAPGIPLGNARVLVLEYT